VDVRPSALVPGQSRAWSRYAPSPGESTRSTLQCWGILRWKEISVQLTNEFGSIQGVSPIGGGGWRSASDAGWLGEVFGEGNYRRERSGGDLTLNDNHIEEDDLERYSTPRLPDESIVFVEQHLLICGICRERLMETEEYVAAMKESARNLPLRSRRPTKALKVPATDCRVNRAGGS
jgi:hypothetical protein